MRSLLLAQIGGAKAALMAIPMQNVTDPGHDGQIEFLYATGNLVHYGTAVPGPPSRSRDYFYGNTVARFLPENEQMRKQLEPLMMQYKVDLVLFGHIHQYQRTCRMVEYKCDARGPASASNIVPCSLSITSVPALFSSSTESIPR